jgi:solute:Na+ symporter, SSS family
VQQVNWTALGIFVDLNLLHEWGLGGRRFGTVMIWFLFGADTYTAYSFIAVPWRSSPYRIPS